MASQVFDPGVIIDWIKMYNELVEIWNKVAFALPDGVVLDAIMATVKA